MLSILRMIECLLSWVIAVNDVCYAELLGRRIRTRQCSTNTRMLVIHKIKEIKDGKVAIVRKVRLNVTLINGYPAILKHIKSSPSLLHK